MTDPAGPLAGLTVQDQKLIMGAFKSLKNGFEVDYVKLAENMDWCMKDDTTKPNAKKANNAWLSTRKKLFPEGFPAVATSEAGASKVKAPATPRKKQDQEAPKTPRTKKTPAKQGKLKADDDGEEADEAGNDPNGLAEETATSGGVKNMETETETEEMGEDNGKESDMTAAIREKVASADGDTPMKDVTADKAVKDDSTTPATGASVADDMSAGSMSPTPASTKAKAGPVTPKPKAAPKNGKTSGTSSTAKAANVSVPVTPTTPTTKVAPKKRKTKAEKDAEVADANTPEGSEDDATEKPAAKKRKSVDGKAVAKNEDDEDAADADGDAGGSGKPTPVKTPRQPSAAQAAKKLEKEQEKAAKKAEKEQEKLDKKAEKEREKEREKAEKKAEKEREKEREKAEKKAEKEREKAEKQADKKAAKGAATDSDNKGESSKPKTPRKPSIATPAKKTEKEEAEKAKKEAEDEAAASAEATRIALAAQEEINKQANDVFNGARIDKPGSIVADEDEDDAEDDTVAVSHEGPKLNGFTAINGTGKGKGDGSRATSVAAVAVAENVKTNTVEKTVQDDGDTIAVAAEEKTIAEETTGDSTATAVGDTA